MFLMCFSSFAKPWLKSLVMAYKFYFSVLSCIFIVCNQIIFVNGEDNYCYMDDSNPYVYFGSRTAYEHIRGSISYLPGCDVIFVWGLLRHGTRFGSKEYGISTRKISSIKKEIIDNHEFHKRGKLCNKDLENLKNWTYKWNENMDYELSSQGEIDMKNLAKRLRASFPSFYNISKDNFTFKTTSKSRCRVSSIAFTNALFNISSSNLEANNIIVDDEFLRILENAPKGEQITEVKMLKKSNYSRLILEEIGSRLGYIKPLSYDFVNDLYTHCAYENAWLPYSRPGFCAAFTKEHSKYFEYAADLEDYHTQGYGDEKNLNRSCLILNDLYDQLRQAKSCPIYHKKGAFYVAHSETLLPTYSMLNLFRDDRPLKYDNYKEMENRKWRSSFMDSFASNLIVVLYRCMGELKVMFYINEKSFSFPGCADDGCSLDSLEDIFVNKIFKVCEKSQGSTNKPETLSIWNIGGILFIFYFFYFDRVRKTLSLINAL